MTDETTTQLPVPEGEAAVEDHPDFQTEKEAEDACDPQKDADESPVKDEELTANLSSPTEVPPDIGDKDSELKEAPSDVSA